VGLDIKIAQQPVDRLRRVADLVIALAAAHQLQPVQRTLPGQRLFQLALAAEQSQHSIATQLPVVVEVFIAQRQPVDALRKHLCQRVLHLFLLALVLEARRQPTQQANLPIRLPQQKRPAIAGDSTSREPSFHAARKMCCNRERFLDTLCH